MLLKLRWNLTRTWSESIWEQQKFTNDDRKLLFSTEKAEGVLKLIHKCDSALRYTHRGHSHGAGGWWNRMGVFFSYSFPIYFVSETHEATLLHQLETLAASTGLACVTINICYATQTWAIKLRLHSYIVLGGSARILWKCSHSPDLKWSLQRQMIKYTAGLFPSITTTHRLKHSFFIALQMSEHKFLSALLPRFLGDSR